MPDLTQIAQRMMTSGGLGDESLQTQMDPQAFGDMFGDQPIPQIPLSQRGRTRLIRSLSNRFGANFRSIPQAAEAMQRFDEDFDHLRKLTENAIQREGV